MPFAAAAALRARILCWTGLRCDWASAPYKCHRVPYGCTRRARHLFGLRLVFRLLLLRDNVTLFYFQSCRFLLFVHRCIATRQNRALETLLSDSAPHFDRLLCARRSPAAVLRKNNPAAMATGLQNRFWFIGSLGNKKHFFVRRFISTPRVTGCRPGRRTRTVGMHSSMLSVPWKE